MLTAEDDGHRDFDFLGDDWVMTLSRQDGE
jgi:hypothetical protein